MDGKLQADIDPLLGLHRFSTDAIGDNRIGCKWQRYTWIDADRWREINNFPGLFAFAKRDLHRDHATHCAYERSGGKPEQTRY